MPGSRSEDDGTMTYGVEPTDEISGDPPAVPKSRLQRLERVSWKSVIQVVLLVLALSVLVRTVAGLDLDDLADELRDANWWLVAVAFLIAQTPRMAQTASTLGAAPTTLPVRPVYLLQLAQSYVGLAVPTSAARIAMNVRFFQRQGLTSGAALAVGGLDSIAGFIVEASLLLGLLLLTPATLHFDLDAPDLPAWRTILLVLVGLAAVIAVVSMLLPEHRRRLTDWLRNLVADGRDALRGINSFRRLALLFGGNLGSTLLFATALGQFASALGTRVAFGDLVVMIISVSLLAGLLPVPGGIGVVEAGLTIGLIAAGMPEEPAFASVILYRIATFYLPPVWGFFAFRSLERRQYL